MKKFYFFVLFFLLLLSATVFTRAEGTKTKTEENTFTLKVINNQINLKAEQASLKDILYDLEEKTGIKINIFDGVDDKEVTLNIRALPVGGIHNLLDKMELQNFGVVYDKHLNSKIIYVLPEGQNIKEVIRDKENKIMLFSSRDSKTLTLDNPATFTLMKKLQKEKQAILEDLEMFPLIKFRDIKKEIFLGSEEVDKILKSKAKTLDIPPKMKRNIASIAIIEDESPYNFGEMILMPDGSMTYLLKIKFGNARQIGVEFAINHIYKDAFILAYAMKNNEVEVLEGKHFRFRDNGFS